MSAPPKPLPLKLDLPKLELVLQPQEWVPNPATAKLASAFTAKDIGHSIYCSQCKKFFACPTAFYGHIDACD